MTTPTTPEYRRTLRLKNYTGTPPSVPAGINMSRLGRPHSNASMLPPNLDLDGRGPYVPTGAQAPAPAPTPAPSPTPPAPSPSPTPSPSPSPSPSPAPAPAPTPSPAPAPAGG